MRHSGRDAGNIMLKSKHKHSDVEKIEEQPTDREQRERFKYMCPLCLCFFNGECVLLRLRNAAVRGMRKLHLSGLRVITYRVWVGFNQQI